MRVHHVYACARRHLRYTSHVGALQHGGNMSPPILKSRGTSYVLVPPHFYHNIDVDWLPPPTYTPWLQRP